MPPMVSTIDIARPPDEVFSYVTNPSRFAEWQKDVVSVRIQGSHPLSRGSRFTTTRRIGGAVRTMTQEIIENRPPRSWAARAIDGPVRPNATVSIEPLHDGAWSRVRFALDFESHGIAKTLLPVVRRQALKAAPASYRNLKQRLESGD
jgi:uncharacterized protein YndB with AHSA1/START domain